VPTEFPPDYPPSLNLKTRVILAEAVKEFSDRSQLELLCRAVVSRVTPHHINKLLRHVREANCHDRNEQQSVERAVINSVEWHTMEKRLLECETPEPQQLADSCEIAASRDGSGGD
jgi:hypothetical protein